QAVKRTRRHLAGGGRGKRSGMETRFVQVLHQQRRCFVALYTGIEPQELSSLLQAVYSIEKHVIGLQVARSSVVVPLSLACRSPDILGHETYGLLLTQPLQEREDESEDEEKEESEGEVEEESEDEEDDNEEEDENEGGEDMRNGDESGEGRGWHIRALAKRMLLRGLISADEHAALSAMAVNPDGVLAAAFDVSTGDREYLAALLKDIAHHGLSQEGTEILHSQAVMLAVADVLSKAGEITPEQLMYLKNLVLVRSEAVKAAFGTYVKTSDAEQLIGALREIATSVGSEAPKQHDQRAVLSRVLVEMLKHKHLTPEEGRLLRDMHAQ
ncbi:unnamed protein product, partial [Chrysoparadoxa australica]